MKNSCKLIPVEIVTIHLFHFRRNGASIRWIGGVPLVKIFPNALISSIASKSMEMIRRLMSIVQATLERMSVMLTRCANLSSKPVNARSTKEMFPVVELRLPRIIVMSR